STRTPWASRSSPPCACTSRGWPPNGPSCSSSRTGTGLTSHPPRCSSTCCPSSRRSGSVSASRVARTTAKARSRDCESGPGALTAEAEALTVALAELRHLDLIRERTRTPELEYVFKHALIHDAAYESILLQRRRELHALAGEAIERLFAARLEEFYGVLAYHFARAERWERAQDYLFKAGERAEKVAGDAEALAHYQQAVAAYARAFGDRWDPVQRAGIERRMGEALFRRGQHLEAREYLDRALALLGLPMPTTPRGVRLAIVRELLRQVGHRRLP